MLHLAASTVEDDVERALAGLLAEGAAITADAVKASVRAAAGGRRCPRSKRPRWTSPRTTRSSARWRHDRRRRQRRQAERPRRAPRPAARAEAAGVRALLRGDRFQGRRARAGPSASTFSTSPSSRSRSADVRRIDRALHDSDLPSEKTLATLDRTRLPNKVTKQLPALCDGGFVERGDNLLVFGLPGRGKTHVVAAIGHELVRRGYRVLFTPTFALVQRLLAAKRDLRLERELVSLDTYHAVILDDIGYVQQSRDEIEVLFTFLAERYERKSVLITSNLVFSDWIRIFKDPMTTAAAIDRLIHHAVILEMTGPSIRNEEALKRGDVTPATTTTTTNQPTTTTPRTEWGDVIDAFGCL